MKGLVPSAGGDIASGDNGIAVRHEVAVFFDAAVVVKPCNGETCHRKRLVHGCETFSACDKWLLQAYNSVSEHKK